MEVSNTNKKSESYIPNMNGTRPYLGRLHIDVVFDNEIRVYQI